MKVVVSRSQIDGTVKAPPSKSYMHRMIVGGLLSSGTTQIHNPLYCDDTIATISAASAMGAVIKKDDPTCIESTGILRAPSRPVDCRGSGTTLRFFTALAAIVEGKTALTGDKTLMRRPMGALVSALKQLGIRPRTINTREASLIEIVGTSVRGGEVEIPGNISSQFISALLFIAPKRKNGLTIDILNGLESQPYVQITLDSLGLFGISAEHADDWSRIHVDGDQEYSACNCHIEGDYSSAAFLFAAGVLAGKVCVTGLNSNSYQGDAAILDVLRLMGAEVEQSSNSFCTGKSELSSVKIDVNQIPDLIPILTVLASQAKGTTMLYGIRRLRWKESDRIASLLTELRKMGVRIETVGDAFKIEGPTSLRSVVIKPHRDHRIAMAGIVAGLIADEGMIIEHGECITKSYPRFLDDVVALGGEIQVVEE
ncbi:MAG: 3-phosphoshikimate 1-carboxyvinyltransferase [Candidatus Thorarchaeota archaeon]